MPLHFETALYKQEQSYLERLDSKVKEWSALSPEQNKIVLNLYAEHFTPVPDMETFVGEIRQYITDHAELFKNKIFSTYQSFSYKGEAARLPSQVTRIGFVLTRWQIEDAIKKDAYDVFENQQSKLDDFLDAKSLGPSGSSRAKASAYDDLSIKGAKSTIWITWSEESPNPFDFIKHSLKEEIYNALALSSYYLKNPIFVFIADLADITAVEKPLRPTVFDAGNYPPFQPPAPICEGHGYTAPYNDKSIKIKGIPLENDPRPEAIVKGNRITWKKVKDYRQH